MFEVFGECPLGIKRLRALRVETSEGFFLFVALEIMFKQKQFFFKGQPTGLAFELNIFMFHLYMSFQMVFVRKPQQTVYIKAFEGFWVCAVSHHMTF